MFGKQKIFRTKWCLEFGNCCNWIIYKRSTLSRFQPFNVCNEFIGWKIPSWSSTTLSRSIETNYKSMFFKGSKKKTNNSTNFGLYGLNCLFCVFIILFIILFIIIVVLVIKLQCFISFVGLKKFTPYATPFAMRV